MAKIFISYARATGVKAQLIAETLRVSGHDVWIDDQLLSHGMFSDTIEKELNAADAAVVIWSSDAARSEWVRAEAERARQAKKLVQVCFEPCSLPMPFDQTHVVDLAGWAGDYDVPAWRSVLASIAAVTGAKSGGAYVKAPAAPAVTDRHRERRQVTTLYCDLVDVGKLASRLDPEDLMDLLDVYQAIRDDIIVHNGGTIAEAVNHAVLAHFGYPRADEEEAANAVRAGIAICEGVRQLTLPSGGAIEVRVGIATGLVVVADMVRGGGRGVVGETPTLATAMAVVATPNSVVVSETTRRITEGLFTWTSLGPTPLSGYPEPVRAFAALAATDVASRSQARSQNRLTPTFGRDCELAQMQQCWALACAGEGQVVLVQGEAGIGKSRLVDAFVAHAAETRHVQSTWFCAPNFSDSALYPIVDQLTRTAGITTGDTSDIRRAKLGIVLDRYGATSAASKAVLGSLCGISGDGDDPVAALTPERRKTVTLDSLLGMMDRFASEAPALFIIEDLHWADPTTLELFDRAVRLAADRSWLILGTARPEYVSGWHDQADVSHIELTGLSRADARRICVELGADAILSTATVAQIIARCDGNPLFVEEMTKSVLEGIAASPVTPGTDGQTRVAIPNTLHDSLAARLDRLGSAKQIASLGAAIGRRFSYELIAAVASQPPAELRQGLRELVRADIVERIGVPPSSRYVFKHALIRDAAYESLLKREREAMHGRIATALCTQFPETLAAEPALVAYHLTESGAIAEAVPLWAEAGQRSAAQGAHAEAAAHLQTALGLVRRLPIDAARVQLELQLLLGLAVSLAGSRGYSVPELGHVLAEARAICDALGNVAGLIIVLRAICAFRTVEGDYPAAEDAARRCSEIAVETGSIVHRIEADTALGFVLACRGDFAAARPLLDSAVRDYLENDGAALEFLQPQRPIIQSLAQLLLLLQAIGDAPAVERALGDMSEQLRTAAANFDIAVGRTYIATFSIVRRDYSRALTEATAALAICDESGYETFAALARANRGLASARLDDMVGGLALASRGIAALERLGIRSLHTYWLAELALLQCEAGDPATALATVDGAIAHALRHDDKYYLSPAYRHRATILRQLPGNHEAEAMAALDAAGAVAAAQGAAGFAAECRTLRAALVDQ